MFIAELFAQLEDSRPAIAFTSGGEIGDKVKAACQRCHSVKVSMATVTWLLSLISDMVKFRSLMAV